MQRSAPPDTAPTRERPVRPTACDLAAGAVLQTHCHAWGQVTYAPSGVLQVKAAGSSWIVPPQRAIWIGAGVEHEITVLESARLRALHVHATHAPFDGVDCLTLVVSPLLRELVEALNRAPAPPRERLLATLIVDEVAGAATRSLRVPLPDDKRLAALCAAVLDDPASNATLGEWARRVGASERTLARLFARELGVSFGQWRQQARLAHAAPMLARGMSMAQVAHRLGYASQSAFTVMFRRSLGCTPSTWLGKSA